MKTRAMHLIRRRAFLGSTLAFAASAACTDDSASRVIHAVKTPRDGIVPAARFDHHGVLHVIYVQGADMYHVESRDKGGTFTEPVRVNDRPGYAAGGLFRGPDMAIDADGSLHVVWYSIAWRASRDKSEQGVMYTRRPSGGAFEASRNLGREPSDGFSIAARDRQVAIAWHNDDLLKVIRSDDGGGSFSAPTTFDALPCECCGTSLQITPAGKTVIAFRDRAENRRDMYLATLDRDASRSVKTRLDDRSWVINACPMSGTGTVLVNGDAIVAWESDGHVFLSRVTLEGLRRSPPIKIGEGKYPIALFNGNSILAAWSDGGKLRWQLYDTAALERQAEGALRKSSPHRTSGAVTADGKFLLLV